MLAIQAQNISKKYGSHQALNSIHLDIEEGKIF